LLYIAVFFAIGITISTYLDTAKTALIVVFTVWVFVVMIVPRGGFIAAKVIAPKRTEESVYMEKRALRNNLAQALQDEKFKTMQDVAKGQGRRITITGEMQEEIQERMKPVEETYRLKLQNESDKIDKNYQREKKRQEFIGETLSRITPTSSLIYLATNLAQTGKIKKDNFFQTGERYYSQLDAEYFSKMSNQLMNLFTRRVIHIDTSNNEKILPPPDLEDTSLADTFRHSLIDLLLLCFFAVVLTTVAFLKFFRLDI